MRYTETKEQSAELLRAALKSMGQHDAAFNPITFAVWYEFSAGTNIRLKTALEQSRVDDPRLGDETMGRLFREHVAPADDSALLKISSQLQLSMAALLEGASQTGDRAGLFGKQLDELSAVLGADPQVLAAALGKTVADTEDMKRSAEALQRQVAASQTEIEHLREGLARARDEALTDALTGILNRKGLDKNLHELLSAEGPAKGTHSLIMLDIDHFKRVNDTYGHVMGDRVIQALDEILRTCVTEPGRVAARYGGEEFALLLPNCEIDEAMRLAASLRLKAKAMVIRDRRKADTPVSVTISLGVTALLSGDDASRFIARADAALYKSKQAGRDRVSFN